MSIDEALRILGLSEVPNSADELAEVYRTATQSAQNELVAAANGAETTAVMDKLGRLRQANIILLPHVRGQAGTHIPNAASTRSPAPSPANAAPPSPVQTCSARSSAPPWRHRPPRRSIWTWIWQAFRGAVRCLCQIMTWPFTAPWHAVRWVHSRLRNWRTSRQPRQSSQPRWKRRVALTVALAVVCAVAAYRYLPGTASIIVASFPAADVFIDGAFLTTAPSPENFEDVAWGWRELACVTPEGLTHRFYVLLLPGQNYRVKVNLQDGTHAVTRQVSAVATTQNARTE
jgi:hypothetical protein